MAVFNRHEHEVAGNVRPCWMASRLDSQRTNPFASVQHVVSSRGLDRDEITYIHPHIYRCIHMHTYIHTYMHTYRQMHTYAHLSMHLYTYIHVCIHAYEYMHVFTCTHIRRYTYKDVEYTYAYTYAYAHTYT